MDYKEQELQKQLEQYLIRIGLSNIPNARRERDRRKYAFSQLLKEAKWQLSRLPALIETKLIKNEGDPLVLEDIRSFLATVLPVERPPETSAEITMVQAPETVEVLPTERPPEAPVKMPGQARPTWIGRVAPTQNDPADADGFPFWVQPEARGNLSLGDILTAEEPSNHLRIVGVVQQLRSFTTMDKISDHYYACDLGRAEAELPTEIPTIMGGRVGILWRSDGRTAPPEQDWPLRRASPEEIRRALAGQIDPAYAVPAGFIRTFDEGGQTVWVPVDMDLRWLAGYESGHINIAGISGVAAKTSYGLFLAVGLLAAGLREPVRKEGGLAVVAFNVKEVDLLYLDRSQGWMEAPRAFEEDLAMWKRIQEDYLGRKDPADFFRPGEPGQIPIPWAPGMRIFAPGRGQALASLRCDEAVEAFRYGWRDLREDPTAFYALFDPDDLDDRMLGAVEAMLASSRDTWNGVRNELRGILGQSRTEPQGTRSGDRSEWVIWNGYSIHRATLFKLANRLQVIEEALGAMLDRDNPEGRPLPVDNLAPGHLWVIDITRLGDRARRYLFFRLMREIRRRLEERKAGQKQKFPGRVVMMVDELNRFAPSGGGRHPLREHLAAVATQGRSYGLTLMGLEQMASRVDEEILVNAATLAVGRSHPSELQGSAYAWLRPYRDQVMAIPTGTMLVAHPLWRQPILVRFPRPLHRLAEEGRRARETRKSSGEVAE